MVIGTAAYLPCAFSHLGDNSGINASIWEASTRSKAVTPHAAWVLKTTCMIGCTQGRWCLEGGLRRCLAHLHLPVAENAQVRVVVVLQSWTELFSVATAGEAVTNAFSNIPALPPAQCH